MSASSGARVTWEAAGDGERRWFAGTLATITVPGEASDGRFALIEFLLPHGASPPLHTHPQDESYVVLEGHLTVQAAGERFELAEGGTALVPMGVPHTFSVDSEHGARARAQHARPGSSGSCVTAPCLRRRPRCLRPVHRARRPRSSPPSSTRTARSTSGRRSRPDEPIGEG